MAELGPVQKLSFAATGAANADSDGVTFELVHSAGEAELVVSQDGTEIVRFDSTGIDVDLNVDSLEVTAGAVGTPSISFQGDPTTGFYSGGDASGATYYAALGARTFILGAGAIEIPSNSVPFKMGSSGDVIFTRVAANKVGIAGTSGGTTNVATAVEALTGMSGATVTSSNLIPAGCFLVGVSVYVDTAIEGATSFNIGDGTDADRWGASIAVDAATTTSIADYTATGYGEFTAANDVVLTGVGGSFSAGAVTVTAHYIDLTAGT